MTIRLATATDVPLMVQLLQEFQNQISVGIIIDSERISRRIQRWPLVHAVDDVNGVYCELKVKVVEKEAEFSAAFPRGASRGLIGPVFAICAREAIRILRAPPYSIPLGQLRTWRVWGEFLHGQDANQVPDGGRSICEAWVAYFALYGKAVTARQPTGGSLWIAEMKAGDLADHGA